MEKIICLIPGCGLEMKDRVNGSHLKRKHNITIKEYKTLYPEGNLGNYKSSVFKCKVCGESVSNKTELKKKHILNHGFKSIDDYNLIHETKMCECGCGEISDYSFIRHKFNSFKLGHNQVWNKGLNKHTDNRIYNSKSGGWNRGLNKKNNQIMDNISKKMIKFWKSNPEKKSLMVKKFKKTMFKRYNVENPNDYTLFWSKYKEYTFPSGSVVKIQGYENLGLDLLIKTIPENDIIVDRKKLPKFIYKKNRKYTPDFFVKTNNTIYEIKSTWTYKIFKNKKEKITSVNNAGFNYTIIIFDKKKNHIIKNYKIK